VRRFIDAASQCPVFFARLPQCPCPHTPGVLPEPAAAALELGVILWVLMGWQFTLAEFVVGPVMVLLLRRAVTPMRLAQARAHAERGIAGRVEGHAAMNMPSG
jgi:hypothetical protein